MADIKGEKYSIKDLSANQEGYAIANDAICFDYQNRPWFNPEATLNYEPRGAFQMYIRKEKQGFRFKLPKTFELQPQHRKGEDYLKNLNYICVHDESNILQQPTILLPPPLQALEEIFLESEVLDEIILHTSILDLFENRTPQYSGIILFGPPGTGKTVVGRALVKTYQNCGANAFDCNLSTMIKKWVGSFGNKLNKKIEEALQESYGTNMPSLLSFDEATSLVTKAELGGDNAVKYYDEGLDALKRHVGNHRELVFCITTNSRSTDFADALIREGRLHPIFIGFPKEQQRKEMWKYFLQKYDVAQIEDTDALSLAKMTPQEHGAFIEEFARTYITHKRIEETKKRGYSSLYDILRKGNAVISEEEIKQQNLINPLSLARDLQLFVNKKKSKSEEQEQW